MNPLHSMPICLLVLLSCYLSMQVNGATSQHLVDDDSDSILYSSHWEISESDKDSGGSLHFAVNVNATATFNFTGIAVEFLAPRWSSIFAVHTRIQLDDGEWETISMVNSSNQERTDEPTDKFSTLWSRGNLTNGPHVINVRSTGDTNDYTIIDAFRYTELVDDSSSSSQAVGSSMVPTLSSSVAPAAPTEVTTTKSSFALSSTEKIGAIVGGTIGALVLIALILLLFLKRRRKPPQNSRPAPSPLPAPANMTRPSMKHMSYRDTMRSERSFVAAPVSDGSYTGPTHYSYIRGTSWDSPSQEKGNPFDRATPSPQPRPTTSDSSAFSANGSGNENGDSVRRPPTAAAVQLKRATMTNVPGRPPILTHVGQRRDNSSTLRNNVPGRLPTAGRNGRDGTGFNPYR